MTTPTFTKYAGYFLLLALTAWTLVMLPFGPFYSLAQQVWYVTLVSNVALILSVGSWVMSARTEEKQDIQMEQP